MAKPVKFNGTPKPRPTPAPVNYAKADTSFDFGANVSKSGKPKRTPKGGGS